jgi:uncharacterized protein (TIGR03086 family)
LNPVDALGRTYDALERLLAHVGTEELTLPTPCEGWTVHQLLNHAVGAIDIFTWMVRDGDPLAVPDPDEDQLDGDPAGSLREAADENLAAWSLRGAADVPTGVVPDVRLWEFLLGDVVVHTWDVARALGRYPGLDDDVVAHLLGKLEGRWAEVGHQMGAFGAPVAVGDDAPALDRLVALTGRTP